VCHSIVRVAAADNAGTAVRKLTHIAAQDLGPALKQLAQSRDLQVLYLSTTVRDVRTRGANGEITANEAFEQLLDGTGLTYRYLDENTVTIVPISDPAPAEGPGSSPTLPAAGANAADSRAQQAKTPTPDGFVLAQAVLGSAPQASAATADSPALREIIVTGSRIAAPNEVSTSPIQVISARTIQASGKTDITDIISQLPQILTNDLGQDLGNGTSGLNSAGGVATADLRGLGPGRTLVLVDGRRLGVGSPNTAIAQPAPDLDQIPAGLVDHVEVVTGGASAAYGSDAIAGVVNFIMKRDFQGFQVDGQVGENWHDNDDAFMQGLVRRFGDIPPTGTARDGRNRTFDVLMGANFADGRGNVTAYLSYRRADPIQSRQRDYGACQLDPIQDAHNNVIGVACGGSSNSNLFMPVTGPDAGKTYSVSGHDFVPWGTVASTPPAIYNSQADISLTREDNRYAAAIMAHDDIAGFFRPYAEFFFMDDETRQQAAPAALFQNANPLDPTGAGDYDINCSNPLLSAQQRAILCTPSQIAADMARPGSATALVNVGRRNIEGGMRYTDFRHTNYRAVSGSTGAFADAWSYDAYGQYFYTTFFDSNQKYLNFQSIANALLVTGTAAHPTCIGASQGCVPYNIFSYGGVTQQQLGYLYESGTASGASTLRTLHADITGNLGEYGVKSPPATDGVGINIGFEHRNDQELLQPDAAEESGLLSGFGSAVAPLDSSISVAEEFVELRAPLVQDEPGAKELLFDAGYRRSDYSTIGVANTHKFEVQYAPIPEYRIRASYDRAIRAPSVAEAFTPPVVGITTAVPDPCAPPITYSLLQCKRTGVTTTQYEEGSIPQGTAAQLSEETSGNPHLKPERADTYTFGVNFAPSRIPHLTGSIDYYHIKIKDEIGLIPYLLVLSDCADTGNPMYCSQIVRQPKTGSLNGNTVAGGGYVIQENYNLGTALNSGIDVQLNYTLDLPPGFGDLALGLTGTYLLHDETTPLPGSPAYDCAGLFGFTCQTVNPRWRHLLRTTWETPWHVSASLTWRFIGAVSEDNNDSDPTLHFSTFNGYDHVNGRIPAFDYLDLEATWNVDGIVQIRAGADNLLDKDPPLVNTDIVAGGAANTYSTYDLFGRQLFLAFTAKFGVRYAATRGSRFTESAPHTQDSGGREATSTLPAEHRENRLHRSRRQLRDHPGGQCGIHQPGYHQASDGGPRRLWLCADRPLNPVEYSGGRVCGAGGSRHTRLHPLLRSVPALQQDIPHRHLEHFALASLSSGSGSLESIGRERATGAPADKSCHRRLRATLYDRSPTRSHAENSPSATRVAPRRIRQENSVGDSRRAEADQAKEPRCSSHSRSLRHAEKTARHIFFPLSPPTSDSSNEYFSAETIARRSVARRMVAVTQRRRLRSAHGHTTVSFTLWENPHHVDIPNRAPDIVHP
jgi:outer membrane receptor protein involved in Fe transport